MSIYVKDLFQLEVFKNFKLVAGNKGLNRKIISAQVLDFEFVGGLENHRKIMFDQDSIVISSLLFAKDNESLLLEALRALVDLNISAFAYKNVIYKQLPPAVIEFADAKGLPILEFQDEDAYFEDIIFEVLNQVKKDSRIALIEEKIKNLLQMNLSGQDLTLYTEMLAANLQNRLQAIYIEIGDEQRATCLLMSFNPPEVLQHRSIVSKYKKDIVIIVSTDKEDNHLQYALNDILFHLGIEKEEIKMGYSAIHHSKSQIKSAIEESLQTKIVGQIESRATTYYQELGLYQMLLPEINSQPLQNYMTRYLQPILAVDIPQNELMKTAIQYVLAKGDLNQTSERLFCHKNTVRYRVHKIHELTDSKSNDLEFYEHLATAVKIYLINQYTL